MEYRKVRVEGKPDYIEVVTISDWHIGSSACDMDLVNRVVEYIQSNDNTYAVILGDIIENGTRSSVGSGVYEQVMNPHEQIDLAIELLEPISDKIMLAVTGNHEERAKVSTSLDVMKIICDRLDIFYAGYRGVCDFSWNKNSYPIMCFHGSGGGKTMATVERRLKEMERVTDSCMVYAMGHFHKKLVMSRDIYRVDQRNGKVRKERVHYVCTPSTMNSASYAAMKGMEPQPTGQAILRLGGRRGNKEVEVDFIE